MALFGLLVSGSCSIFSRVHVIWHFMEDLRAMVQQFSDPQHCEICPYTNPNVDKMAKVSVLQKQQQWITAAVVQ